MFLEEFTLSVNSSTVRRVTFRKGLNLVVDTGIEIGTDSGNSLGKTTFLRSIDYCLGSKGDDIYLDAEFKNENQKIVHFLKSNSVFMRLKASINGKTILLERNLIAKGKSGVRVNKIFMIDGEPYKGIEAYCKELGRRIFKLEVGKPSFRQLISRFIRSDSHKMSKTLKFLNPQSKANVYEPLHLFLMGFGKPSLLSDRKTFDDQRDKFKKQLTVLKQGVSKPGLEQMIIALEGEIVSLENSLKEYNIEPFHDKRIIGFEDINKSIRKITLRLNELVVQIDSCNHALENISQRRGEVDSSEVESLYKNAKKYLPNLQKDFENVVDFHDSMLDNKAAFIQRKLDNNLSEKGQLVSELKKFLSQKTTHLQDIDDYGTLSDIYMISNRLCEIREKKGEKNARLLMIKETEGEIEKYETRLKIFDEEISTYMDDLRKNITVFNQEFKKLSQNFYGEGYLLVQEDDEKTFSIKDLGENVGSGKKKGQIAAFDLAYVQFLNEQVFYGPRFILHDSVEDVHTNQLKMIFECAEHLNGQLIISLLEDKVSFLEPSFLKNATVLELSPGDKFFRIENR